MTARRSLLLAVLGSLLSLSANAAEWIMTPAVEKGFNQLIADAEGGRLDPNLKTANVSITRTSAVVELIYQGELKKEFILKKTENSANGAFFDIEPSKGANAEDVLQLRKALEAAFKEDPWSVSRPNLGAHATASVQGDGGVATLLGRLAADVSRAEVLVSSFLLTLFLATGLVVVWLTPSEPLARDEKT